MLLSDLSLSRFDKYRVEKIPKNPLFLALEDVF
jgi:hypothetical protein